MNTWRFLFAAATEQVHPPHSLVKKQFFLGLLTILLLLAFSGCEQNSSKEPSSRTEEEKEAELIPAGERRPMPDFSLTAVQDGSPVNSKDFLGRITVVAFFSPWCSECITEMGMLEKFQTSPLGAEFSAVGMAVAYQDDKEEVELFIKELGLKLPVVMSDKALEKAFGGAIIVPTAYLIDKKGRIARQYIKHLREERLSPAVDLLLKEP